MKAVGIIIMSEDEKSILLSKRSEKEEDEQGKWENVGGKVEESESFENAVRRECNEELGVTVLEVEEKLVYGEEDSDFCIKVFAAQIQGEPKIMEPEFCDELKWFKIEDLDETELAEYTREDFVRLGWIKAKI